MLLVTASDLLPEAILTLLVVTFAAGSHQCCHKCTTSACVNCPPGHGVLRACNGTTPTVCEPCVAGVNFSQYDDACHSCEEATTCSEDHVLSKPLSPIHNTQCKCKDGYIENFFDDCIRVNVPTTRPVHGTSLKESSATASSTNVTPSQLSGSTLATSKSVSESNKTTMLGLISGAPFGVTISITKMSPSLEQQTDTRSATFDSDFPTRHSRQRGTTSTVYIVVGVCVSIVTLIAAVVGILTYRLCCRNRKGLWCQDEERLIGQKSDRNGNFSSFEMLDVYWESVPECEQKSKKRTIEQQLRNILSFMRGKEYVHGDLREPNILVSGKSEIKLKIVDFNWAGKAGEVEYPLYLNRTVFKSIKPGQKILMKHDSARVDYIISNL